MDRYRNTYHNSSDNDSGGTWVYINGELYHAGVKGMHWYQHLPGTDYWKYAKNTFKLRQAAQNQKYGGESKLKTAVRTARAVARRASKEWGNYFKGEANYYGNKVKNSKVGKAVGKGVEKVTTAFGNTKSGVSKFWNASKGYSKERISELKTFASNAWKNSREAVNKFFTYGAEDTRVTPQTRLDEFQNSQLNDVIKAFARGADMGTPKEKLNYWIQNAQYGIVKGVNEFLKNIAMDDEVDRFMNKFFPRRK